MKVVFSHWSQSKSDSNKFFKELAAVSNFLAKNCGYETVLYTDDLGESASYKIEYDNVVRLPQNVLDKFPKTLWNLGKLLAVSLVKEPFIHLDFDLLLMNPVNEDLLKKPAIFFHQETWMDRTLLDSSFIIKRSPQNLNKNYRSYNCAIMGGTDYKAFNEVSKEIYNFVIENGEYLEKMNIQQNKMKKKNQVKDYLYLPMLVEQLWMPQLLKNKNINIETVLYDKTFDEYELVDYTENYDPKAFMEKIDQENIIKKYHEYFALLNTKAKELGHVHYYGENKYKFKDNIIKFALDNNLKY
jgi:hypothetical protein